MPRMADCGGFRIGVDISAAVDAAVGDAEGAAGQVLQLQRAVAGAFAEIGDGGLDAGEAELVGVADHRHDQAGGTADRDAHVDEILVNDVVAVDLGVDRGEFLQRDAAGADEDAHEAEADAVVLLLEGIAVFAAQRHDRATCPPR